MGRGRLISPGFALLLFGVGAVLVIGGVVPATSAWSGDVVDVDVSAEVEWHPVSGTWSVSQPTVGFRESKLIDFKGILRNALAFGGSEKRPVVFTLETTTGQVLDRVDQSSGKGTIFGVERTLTVTFREVPPGEYVVRVALTDDDARVVQQSTPLRLIETGGT